MKFVDSFEMNSSVELIEKIFNRFFLQTQSTTPQFSRDYFERFTQVLNQTLLKYPELQISIETIISSIISPYHSSNLLTLEYQFRLIRYSLRQHLPIIELQQKDFLDQLIRHTLLLKSSILRHQALQIAILYYEQNLHQPFDEYFFIYIIQLFSSDPNLYVRNTLAEFLALYLSKHDQYPLLQQIQIQSSNSDLIYHILVLLDQQQQESFIQQLNIYDNLSDTPARRVFVLKTAKFLVEEDQIVFYLNRILDKSLSDYVHMLLTIIFSRNTSHRSISKLNACLKALFLYIQDTEIEEIDENEQNILINHEDEFGELTEYICCRLYEANVEVTHLASIVLDTIQPFISTSDSFIYKLDFYSPIIVKMITAEDKNFARLIDCLEKLHEFTGLIDENLYEMIIKRVKMKKRTTPVYQALFSLILHGTNRQIYLNSIQSIVEALLFQEMDQLLQWDNQDCVLHFLNQLSKTNELPSWFTNEFLRRIIEQFVHNNNEYIQGSLIDLLATLVEHHLLSPLDNHLTSNFIQLTAYSLGDVVRCALARAWFIILTQSNEHQHQYPFSFGSTIEHDSLITIITAQIPLLIGDGGHETEIQCLRLIESLEMRTEELDKVLDFLLNDGSSNEIKEHASRLLGISMEKKTNEILEDEFSSILHWLEHPDEHMILDCD